MSKTSCQINLTTLPITATAARHLVTYTIPKVHTVTLILREHSFRGQKGLLSAITVALVLLGKINRTIHAFSKGLHSASSTHRHFEMLIRAAQGLFVKITTSVDEILRRCAWTNDLGAAKYKASSFAANAVVRWPILTKLSTTMSGALTSIVPGRLSEFSNLVA